ncbi:hypothetical protein C2G38_2229121 [Gigaspora rosea]|uniref:Uncharacterized protein n=1 Tax=Gigaspora rosea TaxID=44941 RepID=A0A397TVE2_9GLOM|nr:hypothetical protein C2G38_2229121 [Gigaspora rosea]
MATVAGDLTSIAPLIAEIPNYSEQIPPDEWYQRINQILTLPSITAATFDNPLRADILKSKIAGKYTNIPAQHAGNNIDTPACFIVWLHHKYQTETVGVADGDANILGLLKGHLSGKLYTWMKIANSASINAFFTELKNIQQLHQKKIIKSKTEPYSDISAKTRAEIENIVNSQLDLKTQQLQVQSQQPPLQHSSSQLRPQPAEISEKIYEENVNNLLLWLYAPSLPPKPQIKKNITSNTNDADEITKGMADMSLNIVKMTKSVNAVAKTVKKSQRYCSNCDSDSDTSSNESDSDSNSASGSSSEDSSSESKHLNSIKSEKKNEEEKKPQVSHTPKTNKIKQTILEETIRKLIQSEFEKILPSLLQSLISNSKKNSAIQNSKNSNSQKDNDFINYREPIPGIAESNGEEETLNDPIEIDFVQKKELATNVVTTKCKIKRLVIPAAIVDPGANFPIMTEDIAKRLKLVIDTKIKHDLSGIATASTEYIGIICNVPINFTPGCTIYSDFAIVKYQKLMLILPNTLLDKYDYDLLA